MPIRPAQTTLANASRHRGIGIHSGQACVLEMQPAEADTGIRFIRADLPGRPEIPASIDCLASDKGRQTRLCAPGRPDALVETVEHVLAALAGMNIDNATIEMTGPEPPNFDGSAAEFAQGIARTGSRTLKAEIRPPFSPTRPLAFSPPGANGVEYTIWPSDFLTLTYFLEYDHPSIGAQTANFRIAPTDFTDEIAGARTFCTEEEINALRAAGLIKGGNIDSAIVLGRAGPLNTDLRWPNELARHKLLDLLGDLCLLESPIHAHICARRSGHSANHSLVKFLRKEWLQQ